MTVLTALVVPVVVVAGLAFVTAWALGAVGGGAGEKAMVGMAAYDPEDDDYPEPCEALEIASDPNICPDCHGSLYWEGECGYCHECGYEECVSDEPEERL